MQAYTGLRAIPLDEAAGLQALLDTDVLAPGVREGALIACHTVKFEDGCEADIKVVNSQGGPYVDAVLFDQNGCEVGLIEPQYTLLGKYQWEAGGVLYEAELIALD